MTRSDIQDAGTVDGGADAAPLIAPPPRPGAAALAFEGVALARGRRRVLANLDFAIPEGAFVGVLGANGAGKTTLLRAALGLLPAQAGAIRVLGQAPRRGNPAIGYMPQARRGMGELTLTGFDLVLGALGGAGWGWPFAGRAARRMAMRALEDVDAAALAARPLAELSGGERQRVLFAQSILGDPSLLLLDEPLANLDLGHQRGIVDAVRRVARRRGSTVLFCAHEVNPIIEAVDLVLYLGNGGAALGPVDEVISGPVLSRLYGTPIDVLRHDGRVFVVARDGDVEVCGGHAPEGGC